MKKSTFILTIILPVFILTGSSCSKRHDANTNQVVIEEKDLTSCPLSGQCQNLYSESAEVDPVQFYLKSGTYRVFWSETKFADLTRVLYIKAPMQGDSFALGRQEILDGRVQVSVSCAACYQIAMKVVDGYVKGFNPDPEKRADQRKWLIEAKIIRAAVSNPAYQDTVYLKQRFYPNFVID